MRQTSPASCSPSLAAPGASLLCFSLTQMCRSRPSCQQQKACATVTPVAGDTCQTEPGKAGASAASTVTSSSKKGEGRGMCSMQSHTCPSVCCPSPGPHAPARDASASVSGRCWGPRLFCSSLHAECPGCSGGDDLSQPTAGSTGAGFSPARFVA